MAKLEAGKELDARDFESLLTESQLTEYRQMLDERTILRKQHKPPKTKAERRN
ncbi:MAG: hypothetical protein KGN31_00390 [Betaproteobacteria bacterium]|nr:hypothetical protein [Betaproteobacteria bacterium]